MSVFRTARAIRTSLPPHAAVFDAFVFRVRRFGERASVVKHMFSFLFHCKPHVLPRRSLTRAACSVEASDRCGHQRTPRNAPANENERHRHGDREDVDVKPELVLVVFVSFFVPLSGGVNQEVETNVVKVSEIEKKILEKYSPGQQLKALFAAFKELKGKSRERRTRNESSRRDDKRRGRGQATSQH
jgi:hypothetical protein